MKLGDTIFNGNQFKNVILNSTSYKRLILGVNLVWSYFSIAIKTFKTRISADGGTYESESILEDRLQEITPNLFNSASLVITPNGVKTSKLYSIKPNDGTGDLTVTRNTSATRVNESGVIVDVPANVARIDYANGSPAILVEPQRTNLLLRSEEFENSYWQKAGVNITPNDILSPSGTLSADKFQISSNTPVMFVNLNTLTSPITLSFYIKKGNSPTSANKIGIRNSTNGKLAVASINTDTGEITVISNTIDGTFSSMKMANGWFRFICTVNSNIVNGNNIYLYVGGLGTIASNDIIGNYSYIWGAQLEAGSNATSLIKTVSGSVTRNADVISKTGLSGITSITETFENGTTNVISGNPTSYTISQGRIKQVIGL